MTVTQAPPTPFVGELEVFRTEEEAVQQHFFGFLSLQLVPNANPDVLQRCIRALNPKWKASM